jgi:hypothetical protein
MHVLIARRAVRVTVALSVLLASGFAAQGLAPQPSRAGVVCGGESCSVFLSAFITLSGDDKGDNPGVSIPPPPCWYSTVSGTYPGEGSPAGAAEPFDKFVHAAIKGGYGTWSLADGGGGGGGSTYFSGTVKGQADAVSGYPKYANPAAGNWYGLDATGSVQGQQCVAQRPWLSWVAQGTQPPPPVVPPLTLALYAYAHMTLPTMQFALDPSGRSYVALPTFVKADLAGWGGAEAGGDPYQHVTAHLDGTNETVTVWALAGKLYLTAGGSATPYEPCATLGSSWTSKEMAATGPNTPIDCGVTYRAPSTGGAFDLSGTIAWVPTWAEGGDGPPHGQPVPAGDLYTKHGQGVDVAEIQSINGPTAAP